MKIGGLQKLTLIDFPGRLAATVFLTGCNFRCPFCYSSEIVLPEKIKNQPEIPQKDLFSFLETRKDLLEGIVICGGEPTLNRDLPKFIKEIKQMGFLVKLDTNGSFPQRLKGLIENNLLDYVAMDVKAPEEKYSEAIGLPEAEAKKIVGKIKESIKILKSSDIDFEFRTTVVPGLLKKEDVVRIGRWIGPAPKYFLQNFKAEKTLDPSFAERNPYPQEILVEIKKSLAPLFDICEIR